MGYEPIVYCRECCEPLDVYAPVEERFCCDMCEHNFHKDAVIAELFCQPRASD